MWTKLQLLMQIVGSPKRNLQVVVSAEQVYKGIVDCFRKTYKEAGLRGLYRGAGIHIKIAFSITVIMCFTAMHLCPQLMYECHCQLHHFMESSHMLV